MSTGTPLITIGMTCFNAEDTIERALDSALAQDYPSFEIVLVDDGSSDRSRDIIAAKAKKHDVIRYIPHQKNTGFAGALNTIVKEAKGGFLAIFDDDDVSQPNRIKVQYEKIITYEQYHKEASVLCHVARIQVFDDGSKRYEKTVGTEGGVAPHGKDMVRRVLYGFLGGYGKNMVGSCANCARMGRIEVFRDLGGFDEDMRRGEDTDFSIRFALQGGHFVGVEEPLITQTMTTGEEKTLDKEYGVEKFFTEKHRDFLEQDGWYNFALNWLDIRYANYHQQRGKFFVLLIKLFIKHPIKTVQKILWSLPAHSTRQSFKKWHLGELNG